jgi:hypothetical protein
MDTRKTRGLPARLERLQQRFEHSRRIRKARSHIPGPLWAAAVTMAKSYGLNREVRGTSYITIDAEGQRGRGQSLYDQPNDCGWPKKPPCNPPSFQVYISSVIHCAVRRGRHAVPVAFAL